MNVYLCKPHCILYKWKFKADFHEISCKQFHNVIQTYFTPEILYFSMKFGGMAVYHEGMYKGAKNIFYYHNTEK